jgi:hypothetical protein
MTYAVGCGSIGPTFQDDLHQQVRAWLGINF